LKTRGIRKQRLALLSGAKQVREVLEEFRETCAGIIYSDAGTISDVCDLGGIPCYRLHRDLFRQLDVHETGQAILVVKVPRFQKWRDEDWPLGCTLFVPFQDPRNVGAVIRSAAAFGVSRIVLLEEAAHPYHHTSLRAAGSAVWRTEILEGPSLNDLNVTGVPMVTLSPRGKDLSSYRFPQSFCLVPGLEGPGLPDGLKNAECLSIPMSPGVESLNAAMATGIALYAWSQQG
jgi:tRNA G18 (ribose-2'-O)-methylase SpoU